MSDTERNLLFEALDYSSGVRHANFEEFIANLSFLFIRGDQLGLTVRRRGLGVPHLLCAFDLNKISCNPYVLPFPIYDRITREENSGSIAINHS